MKKRIIEFLKGPRFRGMILVSTGVFISPLCMIGMVFGKMKGAFERYVLLVIIGIILTLVNLFTAHFINMTIGHIEGVGTYLPAVIVFSLAEFLALFLGCVSMSVARRLSGSVSYVGWNIQKSTLVHILAVLLSAGIYFGMSAKQGDPFAKVLVAGSLIQSADEATQEAIRERLAPYAKMRERMNSQAMGDQ